MAPARSLASACLFLISLLLLPTFASGQVPLRGTVTDASGAALARVPVSLVRPDGTTVSTTLTDAGGVFEFAVPCEHCSATTSLAGFNAGAVTLEAGTTALLVLSIAPVRESVVVTATRNAVPTGQIAASVTVFDREAIERRGDALVGDLLRQAPGAAVVQNGGRGNLTSLFVRGGENNYTKVLLDGIALNEPGGAFNFGGLSTGHIDRVEFVRGAHSALFGSDAMAGVLHLVSARGRLGTRPALAGEFSGGSLGTLRGSATLSGGTARWDYSLYGGRSETDNLEPNNHFGSTTISATAGTTMAAGVTVRLVGRYEDSRVGTPGQTAFGRPDLDAFFTQSHLVGGVALEHQATPGFTHRLTYALAQSEQRSTNLLLDAPYTPSYLDRVSPFEFYDFTFDTASRFTRHQAGYQADLRVDHAGVLAGTEFLTLAVDWDGERGTLTDRLEGTRLSPRRDNVGATLQHQHINRRFALTTGLRIERNEHFGTAVAPRVSAAVFLRRGSGAVGGTKLKGNVGRGVKEPTMRQSFSLSPFDLGNPELEAETSRTVDAGVEQRLFGDRVKLEAVWFSNRFDRQISTRTLSFSPYLAQYFNMGRTRARGTEIVAEIVPFDGLRLQANHTFTDSEIIDSSSEFSEVLAAGNWALRRPRHAAQVQVFWDRGRASFDLGGTFVGERSDSDFSALVPAMTTAEALWLWRAQAHLRVSSGATAYVRVENLTDAAYMEPLGYPAWRRTIHAGLRLRF